MAALTFFNPRCIGLSLGCITACFVLVVFAELRWEIRRRDGGLQVLTEEEARLEPLANPPSNLRGTSATVNGNGDAKTAASASAASAAALKSQLQWLAAAASTSATSFNARSRRFAVQAPVLRFLAVGDFGSGGLKEWLDKSDSASTFSRPGDQRTVAEGLERTASVAPRPSFVLGLGDMLYPHGAASVDDDLFTRRFDDVYGSMKPALAQLPWFLTMGNHDCEAGEAGRLAQVARTGVDRAHTGFGRWRLPQKYYSREWLVGGSDNNNNSSSSDVGDGAPPALLRLLVLDACSLVCTGSDDGRCKPVAGDSPAEIARQYAWLESELSRSDATWTIVAGHWPVYSAMGNGPTPRLIAELVPLLQKYGTTAYFSGHDHSLQHHQLRSKKEKEEEEEEESVLDFFVSGAGGYSVHKELNGWSVPIPEGLPHAELVFAEPVHGFMSVMADARSRRLTVESYAKDGTTVLHTSVVEGRPPTPSQR